MCLIAEIVHTCSNEKVAQAAVASIGLDFAGKVGATARARGMSVGAFTAHTVLQFDRTRRDDDYKAIHKAMQGSDQPILSGLKHILRPVVETNL
jgi:hypothetical protein